MYGGRAIWPHPTMTRPSRHGLARTLSKLGVCSRTRAIELVREGRVTVDGKVVLDPERRSDPDREKIAIDGVPVRSAERIYIALNKPRGLIVSALDERGRDTVYSLFEGAGLPWIAPVGRLDKASEGLLLLSNDPAWAAAITDPASAIRKTYHVQVSGIPDTSVLERMIAGIEDRGEQLSAIGARMVRSGKKNAWLEVVLDEGRNRHIRRMLAALGHDVLRLVRIAIGELALGELDKGQWRHLSAKEIALFNRDSPR